MKRNIITLLLLFASFAIASPQNDGKLVIIHTNDLHSRLMGYALESEYTPLSVGDDNTKGGFARIATIIRKEKEHHGNKLLVLDAGDFLMGTLFHHFEKKDGFQLRMMKQMGYDVVSMGNHEFDAGPASLAQMIKAAVRNGDIPAIVQSNAEFNSKDPSDDEFENLFTSNIVRRSIVIDRKETGLKIGIFSLLGVDAVDVAPAAAPLKFSSQLKTARKMVRSLRAEGCNMIICLSHSGVSVDKKGRLTGEDYKLASKVKGLDLIISGHTHTALREPLMVKGIPVVQTGSYGEYVGRITFDISGTVPVFDSYELMPVNDAIPGDEEVNELLEKRIEMIDQSLLEGMGLTYGDIVAENSYVLECDEHGNLWTSNLGPLVADAIHSFVNRNTVKGTDISIVAAGVIRDNLQPGKQSVPDIFRVMSLGEGSDGLPGYPLSQVYVTGRELKNIIEVLLIAWKKSPSNFIYYSGLNIKYNPSKGMLRKVQSVTITGKDGIARQVDFSKRNPDLYSITANSYILKFVGIIKSMSFGLIKVTPKDINGNPLTDMSTAVINFAEEQGEYREGKEWLALLEYLSLMPDINGNGIPDISDYYIKPELNVVAETGR